MTPVFGNTALKSQEIIGLKKDIPAYLLQYEARNLFNSPRENGITLRLNI